DYDGRTILNEFIRPPRPIELWSNGIRRQDILDPKNNGNKIRDVSRCEKYRLQDRTGTHKLKDIVKDELNIIVKTSIRHFNDREIITDLPDEDARVTMELFKANRDRWLEMVPTVSPKSWQKPSISCPVVNRPIPTI
ncbi:6157_t:CDS:2, partial [Cetraspora pellucida]